MTSLEVLVGKLGQWVNDLDIIEEAGLGALAELRQLRAAGTPLRARPHPNGQGLQWRLDQLPESPPEPPTARDKPFPIERTPEGRYQLREEGCWDCGGSYRPPYSDHLNSPRHRAWVAEHRGKTQITAFEQPRDEPVKPLDPDAKLVFGSVKMCPRCDGKIRPARKDRKTGKMLPADTMCMDPDDRDIPCRRCKGSGVVQLERASE